MQLNRVGIDVSPIFDEEIIGHHLFKIIAFEVKTIFQLLHTWLTLYFILNQICKNMGSLFSIS